MANNTVEISGMFGNNKTYFADSPVVIDISGLEWPVSSPFNIVRIEVLYGEEVIGDFPVDTGRQSGISFNINSALQAIWSGYGFDGEIAKAQAARTADSPQAYERAMRGYSLRVYTEYMASDDGGVFTRTGFGPFTGGQCLLGGLTEWERSIVQHKEDADVSHLEHTGIRNGDASTKPTSSLEKVGRDSITSWVDVKDGYTKTIFYPAPQVAQLPAVTGEDDDVASSQQGWSGHSPKVLRDSQPYTDFLFVNRRGAVETCSALMMEALNIDVETKHYSLIERPSFKPSRTLTAVASGGRRSWAMSSGLQTRQWAEWWTMEFLKARRWWMLYKGPGQATAAYVPVIVDPVKKSTNIYDRAKQQMTSVDFTVTMALEG